MRIKSRATPYLLLSPVVFLLLLFSLYPFLDGIWSSFTDIDFIGDESNFIGFANYENLLTDEFGAGKLFREAAVRSIFWTTAVVAGQLCMALVTALLLNERFPGRGILRTAIFVPIAIPSVIVVLTWQWMYDPFYGLINHYLQALGLLDGPKAWILQPNSSMWPLIIVGIWIGFPFMSMMLLSGLQGIPNILYEAAKVDGASRLQLFRYITLPQLRTVIAIAVMLHSLWWWNNFDIIQILGAPAGTFSAGTLTLPVLSWFEAFRWSHLSRGAALAVISMVFLAGIMLWNARRELRSVK